MSKEKQLKMRIEELLRYANSRQIIEHVGEMTHAYVNDTEGLSGLGVSASVGLSNQLVLFFLDVQTMLSEIENKILIEQREEVHHV